MNPSSPPSDNSRRNSPQPTRGTATSAISSPSRLVHRSRIGSRTSSIDTGKADAATTPIPDEDHGADLPLTMSASVVLTGLPRDAHQALADAEAVDTGKVTIKLQALPGAPILKKNVFKVSASQKFETVVRFLRKKLDCRDTDSVFCYIHNVFAPGLDEGVGGLYRCFQKEGQLTVAYSMTPSFG